MLTEICAELKNYFIDPAKDIHAGDYTISGGSIDLPFLLEGQYFRIVGSALNDGVWQYPAHQLQDEVFSGAVWAMRVPPSLIALAAEIEQFNAKVDELCLVEKGYASETWGGYSYTLLSGAPAFMLEWQKRIERKLRGFRRLFVL